MSEVGLRDTFIPMAANPDTAIPSSADKDPTSSYRLHVVRLASWLYLFSLALIAVSTPLMHDGGPDRAVIAWILGTGLLAVVALRTIPWHVFRPAWLLVMVVVAVVHIGVLVAHTGRDDSPYFVLYSFVIIVSDAYFQGPALLVAVMLVILGSIGYDLLQRPIHFDFDNIVNLPVYIAGVFVTNLLFRHLQERSEDTRRQARYLEALYEASQLLHAESGTAELYRKLLDVARRATGARYGELRTFDDQDQLAAFFHAGLSPEEVAILKTPPADVGVRGTISLADPTVRLDDLTRDPSHRGYPAGHPQMRTFLGVAIRSGNRLLGKLHLTEKENGVPFTEEDEALVIALARDAALAIDKAKLLEKVEALATTDALTGLANRRVFEQRLTDELDRSNRYGHSLGLLMADVDDFKRVNDTYGHAVGDVVLQAIASILRRSVREIDLCVRYGGEEFAVILPHTDKEGGLPVAERIRKAVTTVPIVAGDDPAMTMTLSIGVATYPEDGKTPDQLVHAADVALYRAKHLGKNRVDTATARAA